MSKNSEYWEKRIAQHTWSTYNSIEEKNIKLLDMYQQASKDISNELYSLAEKVNSGKGLTRSEMHKYNRLSNLNKNIRDILEDLTNKVAQFSTDNMQEGFVSNYNNVMGAMNIIDFALPDKKLMDTLLNVPWRGDSFSKRLWKDTGKLANNLNNILTSGLQQGKTVSEVAINLNNAMNQGFNNAHQLVRTETMHYLNMSSDTAYKDAGVKEVQNWAAEDERTCEHCAAEHGKIYPIDKAPTLPLHPNCRCTRLPVIDKNVKSGIISKNVEMPEEFNETSVISDDIKTGIKDGIEKLQKEYDIKIDYISFENINEGKVPLQFYPIKENGLFKSKLIINKDFNWNKNLEEFNERIYTKNYLRGMLSSKNVDNLIAHESAHFMSFQDCSEWNDFITRERELRVEFIEGISGYADSTEDGAESLAEAFVKQLNGEEIPKKAKDLINKYITRWKK